MNTVTENERHMEIYTEQVRAADKRRLPDVISDIDEAKCDGVISNA